MRSATSGRTGSSLTSFITGQPIVAVMADLATFVGARQEPQGPVETFSTERARDTVTRPMSTEDVATILLRFANGARGSVAVSQISAGRKNSLRYEIDGSARHAGGRPLRLLLFDEVRWKEGRLSSRGEFGLTAGRLRTIRNGEPSNT